MLILEFCKTRRFYSYNRKLGKYSVPCVQCTFTVQNNLSCFQMAMRTDIIKDDYAQPAHQKVCSKAQGNGMASSGSW